MSTKYSTTPTYTRQADISDQKLEWIDYARLCLREMARGRYTPTLLQNVARDLTERIDRIEDEEERDKRADTFNATCEFVQACYENQALCRQEKEERELEQKIEAYEEAMKEKDNG